MRISDWRSDVCSSDRLALKMADQGGNILGAAGQAGDLKHNHAEPEEQVFAELAIGDRGAQILVRRRNDADINAAHLAAADGADRPDIGSATWRDRGCQYV